MVARFFETIVLKLVLTIVDRLIEDLVAILSDNVRMELFYSCSIEPVFTLNTNTLFICHVIIVKHIDMTINVFLHASISIVHSGMVLTVSFFLPIVFLLNNCVKMGTQLLLFGIIGLIQVLHHQIMAYIVLRH